MEKAGGTEEAGKSPSLPPPPPTIPSNVNPESMKPPKYSIASRRGVGTSGRQISLLANHFKVSVNATDAVFSQYTVGYNFFRDKIVVESKGIGIKLVDKLYQTYSSELAGKRSPDGDRSPVGTELSYSAEIPLKSISLALKGVESDNSIQDALRVLDIILRQQAANRGCLSVRQSFFQDDSRNYVDVGGGVLGLRGFHSSFHPTQGGLSLNMDVSTTMILKPGPVIDFLKLNLSINDDSFWPKAKRMLKNMRIKTTHRNMEFRINGLSEIPVLNNMKNGDSGEGQTVEITVYEYFTKHCGIELTYSGGRPCLDVGKPKQPNYLPLELCSLVSLQRYTKALSSNQRATLVERSRQKPWDRIRTLTDAVRSNQYDEDPVLSACGISLGKQLTEVDGRVLETPRKLLDPKKIERWIVVNFSAHCDISRISRDLISCARNKGIEMERPHTLIEEDQQAAQGSPAARVEAMFEHIIAKLPGPPDFVLCVLPVRNSDIYGPWKKKCLSDIGVVTQCICPVKINDQYLTNVLLKINSKVVGSHYWPLISRYRASVRTQSSKVEMIDALYKPLANGKDDGIIRDGVSESQFNQVLNIELEQIIKAYQHLGEADVPKFTVIVAQKNHHTKLFQANAPGNVPPGTVVDTKFVHPRNYDFYLCAHAGMIGTSRPAHYHVLLDEIGFSPNDLQNLIHSLSYVYQRSTTAISIVAPICYAHLAAQQMG
ncbi:hypothetical protein CRYUN_Cryun14cG0147400 [Craigia yunnanensis]